MFSKLNILAFALSVVPFVSAVQFEVPKNPATESTITIKWTTEASDPGTWSLELINDVFNRAYAIGNNLDPSLGSITITLPAVPPGDGYTLEAVNIGNINEVYGTSPTFTIGPAISASVSSPASTPSGSGGNSQAPPPTRIPTPSASTFGSIVKPSNTPVNQPSGGNSNNGNGQSGSGAGAPQPSEINGGMMNVASYVVVAASALFGALVVA